MKAEMMQESLNPVAVAHELLARAKGQHRNAEAEAWKLRAAHGPQTPEGVALANAAFIIADMYHDSARDGKGDTSNPARYYDTVPVFDHGPNSTREQ